ncbi:MAG: hypothetical protein J7604_22070 [Sporocytophaga sp.]|uniref:hypothetical protein n=1 Tax=Sporocytophaga sp. TaxID=2231183 RepID=UPI001B0A2E0B|nr:hypothetical protein [Sporocytophaga sp.]MBO9702917.1 hypothetical protein [Sporocytophaga sp.]
MLQKRNLSQGHHSYILIVLLPFLAFSMMMCKKDKEEHFAKALYFNKKSESDHFIFYYDDGLDTSKAQLIAEALEASYDSVINHLKPGSIPKIRIVIWSEKNQFEKDMGGWAPGAAGYVYDKEEVRLLYTGAPGMLRGAVHEFTHAVTLFISGSIANNPRWLWESVAQYECGEKTDLKKFSFIVNGEYPSLDELSKEQGSMQRIYPLGYCISEFIVNTWSYDGLRSLIVNNGNIKASFGIEQKDFEMQWHNFIEERYLK